MPVKYAITLIIVAMLTEQEMRGISHVRGKELTADSEPQIQKNVPQASKY